MNSDILFHMNLVLNDQENNFYLTPELIEEFCKNPLWKWVLCRCTLKNAKELFKYKSDDTFCLIYSLANKKEVVEFVMKNVKYDINDTDVNEDNFLHHFVYLSLCYEVDYNVLDLLLEMGCDVNCINNEGRTPLMYSVEYGKTEIIKKLLEFGADTKIADGFGKLPKYYTNNEEIRKLLL